MKGLKAIEVVLVIYIRAPEVLEELSVKVVNTK